MSIRAYKIIEIKNEKDPTFAMCDDWLTNQLDLSSLNNDCAGILIVYKSDIKKMQKKLKADNTLNKQNKKWYRGILNQMLKECNDEDFVEYYLY